MGESPKTYAKVTTGDKDILRRDRVLLDFDPIRPSEISSEAEHQAALERARAAMVMLAHEGWSQGILADSGNGGHVVYRIALPNDEESAKLIEDVLKALAKRFDDEKVKLDQTVFNASRIVKCWGTVTRKGDNIPERPHRISQILEVPPELRVITREQLQEMAGRTAGPRPLRPEVRRERHFDLDGFISRYLKARPPVAGEGGKKWVLEECPFNSDHKAPDAAVFKTATGVIGFHCFHNSCASKNWRAVRELFEGPRREHRSEPPPHQPPQQSNSSQFGKFDVEEWSQRCGLELRGPLPYPMGTRMWHLRCPFDSKHPEASLFEMNNRALVFQCSVCPGYDWSDFKTRIQGQTSSGAPPSDEAASDDGWPEPQPLQGELPPVEPFDAALLPESMQALVVDVSDRMQVPMDFPGCNRSIVFGGCGQSSRGCPAEGARRLLDSDPQFVGWHRRSAGLLEVACHPSHHAPPPADAGAVATGI